MKPYRMLLRDETMVSVEDYRRRAARCVPKMVWSYVEGGADDLTTLRANIDGYARYRLRQRALRTSGTPDLSTTIARTPVAVPFAVAPTGLNGLTRWDGDLAIARAAEAAGTRCALSNGSTHSIEEVAAVTKEAHWFQLYAVGDRQLVGSMIERAHNAGNSALFVTVDSNTPGNREGERKHGFGVPLRLTPTRCLGFARHPKWLYRFLRHRRMGPINFDPSALSGGGSRSMQGAANAVEAQLRFMGMDLNWDDIAWIRDQWKGPFYVKGLLDPEDAKYAVDVIGAEGVIVSNHGGRQLDDVTATIDALPHIVSALGGRGEVYLDGGIRRGTDIIKALCLGARGVFVGRAVLYGAAVSGQAGVAGVLKILRDEVHRGMVLMGCNSVADLDRSWLVHPDGSPLAETVA